MFRLLQVQRGGFFYRMDRVSHCFLFCLRRIAGEYANLLPEHSKGLFAVTGAAGFPKVDGGA